MESFSSEIIQDLASAMLKVQADISPAIKDGENPFAKNRYATLNSVVTASREALIKHGIWLVQYPVPVETGHLGLVTKLIHAESGQWQSSLLVMPLPKSDPQGYGSALTYSRRYALASLVGLVVEDDDGEAACGQSKRKNRKVKDINTAMPFSIESREENPGHQGEPEAEIDVLKNLPKLDGINYQTVKAADGQLCIIAMGNTSSKKEILSGTGFKLNKERRIWWMYADSA